MADRIKYTPGVWGGKVVPVQGELRGYELEQGGPIDFGYELPVEGAGEEVAVDLGELRQATEEPARPPGTMGGRVWVPSQAGSEATMRPEGATAFWGWSDAQVKAELRKMYDKDGNRLYEIDDSAAFERSIARDAEINAITFRLWKENCEGLRRIGVNTDRYERAGPVTYGANRWEHPSGTRMIPRSEAAIKHHDAQQPSPGRRRLCGEVLAIR